MSQRLLFRAQALSDIDDAYRWYESQRAGLGVSFIAAIEQASIAIEHNPLQYVRVRGEIRRAILQRFPYSIFYIARANALSVIAVLHQARHPSRWQYRKPA